MRMSLAGTLARISLFLAVCLFFTFAMFAVFSDLRFQAEKVYQADFTNVSGLKSGQFVRIAGVEVGKVKRLTLQQNSIVRVEFTADDSVVLTDGSKAIIRYDDLIGGRYLALEEGAGGIKQIKPGETIPLSNTSPALDLDSLIGGFRPLFRALDPEQVNALSSQLIDAFQGQGDTVSSLLQQTAALTTKLGDRDQLIGQVIGNLNAVLGSLGDENTKFAEAIDSLSQLVATLADRKSDISNSLAYTNAAATSIADLLSQSRQPIQKVVQEIDRAAGIVVADHDYFDNLLKTLPEAYRVLGRQALYGDFFGFYMCNALLKLNGKGGQPTYVKVISQASGRCTPK